MSNSCPCGSQKEYPQCCGIYIDGDERAPTPETLMRSRYTAFTKQKMEYIVATWHPETRPEELSEDEPSNWIGLEILNSSEDGEDGEVEFIAKLIYDGKIETLHELSEFERIDGAWLYVQGEFKNENNRVKKISKNEPCPCGSGKKFKRCHGA